MRKSGGLVALAAGVCGVVAAIITLIIAGAFADHAPLFALLEWRGVVFSLFTIVLGAICMFTTARKPALLLLGIAVAGVILNGTLVSFWMVMASIGALIALFGDASKPLSPYERTIDDLPIHEPLLSMPKPEMAVPANRLIHSSGLTADPSCRSFMPD